IVKPRNFSARLVRQFRFNTTEAFQAPDLLVLCCNNHAYDVFDFIGRGRQTTAKGPRDLWTSRMPDDYQRIKFLIGSALVLTHHSPTILSDASEASQKQPPRDPITLGSMRKLGVTEGGPTPKIREAELNKDIQAAFERAAKDYDNREAAAKQQRDQELIER